MNRPLSHVKVLDLTHMLAGPYATMLMADLGAEVIKIEPQTGEVTRNLLSKDKDFSLDGVGAYHLTLSRNKKSLLLDLKKPEGKELFYDLVKKADVVVNNFSQGVTERLEITHDDLIKINPKIITCDITGFGQTEQNRPAYDAIVQAYGGGMSITGFDVDKPVRSGIPHGDIGAGLFAVIGVLSALQSRQENQKGSHVDISMLDCQVSMLNYMSTMYFLSGKNPEPIGNEHFVHFPYDSYKTKDGSIMIGVVAEGFWPNLIEAVNDEYLKSEEFLTLQGRLEKRKNIDKILRDFFGKLSNSEAIDLLQEKRVPCAPINKFSDAFEDPDLLKRNMIVDVTQKSGKSVKMPGNPVKISNMQENFDPAPELGEHSEEVLKSWLDLDEEAIKNLKSKDVI